MRTDLRARRLPRAYRALALMVLNTAVVFALVDLALRPFFPPPESAPSGPADIRAAVARFRQDPTASAFGGKFQGFFPDLAPVDIAELMAETLATYSRPLRYEPWTQFREHPYTGRFITVDAAGFRHGADQGPWPPDTRDFVVFVFGGSTTFGYGLPGVATVPSALQGLLGRVGDRRVRVYNFGRGFYFSTQERVLFERLLHEGHRPDLAVFIDGLNDFYSASGEPEFTERLARLMARPTPPPPTLLEALGATAIGRAATSLRARLAQHQQSPDLPSAGVSSGITPPAARTTRARPTPPGSDHVIDDVIRRVQRNKQLTEAAARAFDVATAFVWQPVPTYKHAAIERHDFGPHARSGPGYAAMADLVATGALGDNFLWCADIQQGLTEELYLDQVHYTPHMARLFATCIADQLRARRIVATH